MVTVLTAYAFIMMCLALGTVRVIVVTKGASMFIISAALAVRVNV